MTHRPPQPAEIPTVHELVVINEHHAASLESVAEVIEDRGLGQVLADFAFDCEQFSEELKHWLAASKVATDIEDHTCEPIEQSIARHESRQNLLASTEQVEQRIIERYRHALSRIYTPDLRQVVSNQYDQLQDIQTWLHRVRLAVAA